jgi:hypothetical protein
MHLRRTRCQPPVNACGAAFTEHDVTAAAFIALVREGDLSRACMACCSRVLRDILSFADDEE